MPTRASPRLRSARSATSATTGRSSSSSTRCGWGWGRARGLRQSSSTSLPLRPAARPAPARLESRGALLERDAARCVSRARRLDAHRPHLGRGSERARRGRRDARHEVGERRRRGAARSDRRQRVVRPRARGSRGRARARRRGGADDDEAPRGRALVGAHGGQDALRGMGVDAVPSLLCPRPRGRPRETVRQKSCRTSGSSTSSPSTTRRARCSRASTPRAAIAYAAAEARVDSLARVRGRGGRRDREAAPGRRPPPVSRTSWS
jgi:hypothetical protein